MNTSWTNFSSLFGKNEEKPCSCTSEILKSAVVIDIKGGGMWIVGMAKRNSILKRAAGQKHFKYLAGYHVHGTHFEKI